MPEIDLSALDPTGNGSIVSVIVPTYGDADLLPPALESIARQTYDNIEIVIVDSSGVGWVEQLASEADGIRYVFQQPQGLAAARNRGIDESTGDVVAFLDADDRWLPEKLEKQVAAVNSGADVVYSDAFIVTDDGKRRPLSALPVSNPTEHHLTFLYEGGVPILTVIARRECFDRERFNEDLPAVEDRNLLARLFARFEVARVATPLAEYRQRNSSMSSDAETMYRAEMASLEHLTDELPSVKDNYENLAALAEYKYGKRLLRGERPKEARRHLLSAWRSGHRDHRITALVALSLIPIGHRRALWQLERIQERLR